MFLEHAHTKYDNDGGNLSPDPAGGHSHLFGQEQKKVGEVRTLAVVVITVVMMAVEISAGMIYGSMALLADGLHMASHAVALAITYFAYIYARRRASDRRFSFGTGKVNALGGYTGAVLLAVFALFMAGESLERLVNPVLISFDQAIIVAVLGLIVNGASVLILNHDHEHRHDRGREGGHNYVGHDHNLRAAYFHVLADALTSLLAIFALLTAKYAGLIWMDPLMGIVGAGLVTRWSLGLLKSSGAVLLDTQASEKITASIRERLESEPGNRVDDLHVWSIGPGIWAVIVSVTVKNRRPPDYYKKLLPSEFGLEHVSIEIHDA